MQQHEKQNDHHDDDRDHADGLRQRKLIDRQTSAMISKTTSRVINKLTMRRYSVSLAFGHAPFASYLIMSSTSETARVIVGAASGADDARMLLAPLSAASAVTKHCKAFSSMRLLFRDFGLLARPCTVHFMPDQSFRSITNKLDFAPFRTCRIAMFHCSVKKCCGLRQARKKLRIHQSSPLNLRRKSGGRPSARSGPLVRRQLHPSTRTGGGNHHRRLQTS